MGNASKMKISEAPKSLKIALILLPIVGFLFIPRQLDNDFYFLYPTGEFIINNGFPVKDFLSMHGNMDIVVQQWLIDVIFYGLYSKLGIYGILGFIFICYAAFAAVMYKLCHLISNNFFTAAVISFITDMIAAAIYMRSRPHALSFVLFLLEILALESYVKTKKVKWLCLIPLISLIMINAHASMWLLMFVFALPYTAEAISFKFKNFRQEPCCNFFALLITGAITFAVGFINPYGIKAMSYVLTSFGKSEINAFIIEMNTPKLTSSFGLMFYPFLLICAVIVSATRKKNFKLRFVLLFCGTMVLAFMNSKSVPLFVFLGLPAFSYYLKDLDFSVPVKEKPQGRTLKEKLLAAVLAVVIIACIPAVIRYTDKSESIGDNEAHDYANLDAAIEILDKEEGDIVLFTGFNQGQYLEFHGYHPYIDGRAELFLKENNHEFDYFGEYASVVSGDIDYTAFINKYGFTHLIVSTSEQAMYDELSNNENFEVLYKGYNFTLFKNKLDNKY